MNKDIMKKMGFAKEVEAIEHGFCGMCKKPIVQKEFRNPISIKEFKISGMCQKCQDDFFGKD
jgi:hypothetical protein